MGGSNIAETPKGNWATEKKTPQAIGDAPLYEKPELLQPYAELLQTGKQNISLGEMISPYYGGEESLKSEIEKAKEYSQSNISKPELGMKMDYEKIGEKIPISSGQYASSFYSPTDKIVTMQEPVTLASEYKKISELEKEPNDEKTKDLNKFLYKNLYTKKDIEEIYKNPISGFMGTLEHEVGHHATTGKTIEKSLFGSTHMDKPVELANQLGKIQREAFYLYGNRFTPESFRDFIDQQKSVPENERFQNFSPDTRRGLKKIFNLYVSPSDTEFKYYQEVEKSLPEFVKAKPQSSYDAIEKGLTDSENVT